MRGREGEVSTVSSEAQFWRRVEAAGGATETVPEMTPAKSVSVEVVTKVKRVVSVTRVVSVGESLLIVPVVTQVVLTVMSSVVTVAAAGRGRRDEEPDISLASMRPEIVQLGERFGMAQQPN